MKPLLMPKPLMFAAAVLLMVQTACAASSVSPSSAPAATSAGSSSNSAQALATQSAATSQVIPVTGNQATAMPAVSATSNPTTPADAQAMLHASVQHYQSVGRDQALKDFTNQVTPFNSDSLFMLCIDSNHAITAIGGNPILVGLSADQLSDSSGPFGQLVWELASAEPKGSLPFLWKDPMSDQQQPKVLYYQKLSQDVCGVVGDQP